MCLCSGFWLEFLKAVLNLDEHTGWRSIGLLYSDSHICLSVRNWCPQTVTKTVTCQVQNGTTLQRVYQTCRWPQGCNGGSYRTVVRPSYKVVYRTITSLEWKCCPGYSGPQCEEDCLNCSRITALTDRVSSLEAKVKGKRRALICTLHMFSVSVGKPGSRGLPGPKGDAGSRGPSGAPGSKGTAGPPGTLNKSSPPHYRKILSSKSLCDSRQTSTNSPKNENLLKIHSPLVHQLTSCEVKSCMFIRNKTTIKLTKTSLKPTSNCCFQLKYEPLSIIFLYPVEK
uniref:EMI domain-containing protein n=1 Tax=Sinocyclocheilus rhinocerous TaxID=307959 RepID=A0A673JN20_9TELE